MNQITLERSGSEQTASPEHPSFRSVLGPGLLFAASSVGVSHIIQSTRAGALFGLGLIFTVLIVNLLKYPAFRFGSTYSLVTGMSILQGYRNVGHWAVVCFALLSLSVMLVAIPALTLATAAVIITVTGIQASITLVSALLMAASVVLLVKGGYGALESIIKLLVAIFSLLTLIATISSLWTFSLPRDFPWLPAQLDLAGMFFIVAFLGWMPTSLEVSVWQSLWTLQKVKTKPGEAGLQQYKNEFKLGYSCSLLLALCFMVLGATLSQQGGSFSSSAPKFIEQIIQLYAVSIGQWCVPLIGLCTFAVLFSTLLTVIDGFPRSLAISIRRLHTDESPWSENHQDNSPAYFIFILLGCVAGLAMIYQWSDAFKSFIDFATTVSFVFAPIIAYLNHRAMYTEDIPVVHRPEGFIRWISFCCIVALSIFALGFIYLKFFHSH